MNGKDLAKEIISKVKHITIASVDDQGQPWNTPVYAAFDEAFNFYWTSAKSNQHSKNIRNNPKIFIVIYDSTGTLGDKTGVYIVAEARELNDPNEVARARSYTQRRKGEEPDGYEEFVGGKTRRLYKATPQKFWVNDAEFKNGDFQKDYLIPVDLNS